MNIDAEQTLIGDGYSVLVNTELDHALYERWNALLPTMSAKHFLHLPQWYVAYLGSYYRKNTNGVQSVFLELRRHDNTLAILPLVKKKLKVGLFSAHALELMWPTDLGVRDCIVSDQSDDEALSDWFVHALKHAGIQWDLISMPDIIEGSAAFQLVCRQKTFQHSIRHHHYTARIAAEGDTESCLSFLSSRMRKRLKTYYQNLSQKGDLQFRIAKHNEVSETLFDTFLDVEASGWKGGEGTKTALRYNAYQQQFYRSLFCSGADACIIASLWVNDYPIAAKICLEVGDTINMLKIGYDIDFAGDYPGMLLLRHLIQHYATHPQIRYIAFVTNPEWAQRWRPDLIKVYEASIFNGTTTGKILYNMEFAKNRARKIKSALKAFGEK